MSCAAWMSLLGLASQTAALETFMMNAKKTIAPISQHHIAPQTGVAFTVQNGQIIRVIDVDGEQVADLVCFARQNKKEYLSSGNGFDCRSECLFCR